MAVGKSADLIKHYDAFETKDAGGKFVYPGFIDAHSHFTGYALSLQQVQLQGTGSWQEVVNKVIAFAAANPNSRITGRGWDQNDWAVKNFPDKAKLDSAFPNTPVILSRIDGHAAIANQAALDAADVKAGQTLQGGIIETKAGKLTGILVDNAVDLVWAKIPTPTIEQYEKAGGRPNRTASQRDLPAYPIAAWNCVKPCCSTACNVPLNCFFPYTSCSVITITTGAG
ncbi:amidohydrolase family protein [Chitinophaga sedimenti]|uniref:amidohydrolase family protein n=1 Tax=Chitinophaga sedimenti TaxID=2033606 RepID=UPI0027E1F611|nr:amidohydrolase family protein [Chitinophaga sedimenti]